MMHNQLSTMTHYVFSFLRTRLVTYLATRAWSSIIIKMPNETIWYTLQYNPNTKKNIFGENVRMQMLKCVISIRQETVIR